MDRSKQGLNASYSTKKKDSSIGHFSCGDSMRTTFLYIEASVRDRLQSKRSDLSSIIYGISLVAKNYAGQLESISLDLEGCLRPSTTEQPP